MKCYSQSCRGKHGQVVCTVAHGNGLFHVHLLHLRYEAKQFCLALAVYHLADIVARQVPCLVHLQFVGIDIVDAVLLLYVFPK